MRLAGFTGEWHVQRFGAERDSDADQFAVAERHDSTTAPFRRPGMHDRQLHHDLRHRR